MGIHKDGAQRVMYLAEIKARLCEETMNIGGCTPSSTRGPFRDAHEGCRAENPSVGGRISSTKVGQAP